MAHVENLLRLQEKLKSIAKKYQDVVVIVGYTAAYAAAVHEKVEMKLKGLPRSNPATKLVKGKIDKQGRIVKPITRKILTTKQRAANIKKFGRFWDPQGQAQAKFLEAPARKLGPLLGSIVRQALKAGKTFEQAMLLAGLRLQRESQLLVPVDTGNLKNSAFTRLDK